VAVERAAADAALGAPAVGAMSATRNAARLLDASHMGTLLRSLERWRGVLVLTYHRIGDGRGSPFLGDQWSADADTFDRHVALLAREADVIGAGELREAIRERRGRHVMVTFDDGYRDAYDVAYPILRAHGVPATFFLATSFIDRPRPAWWDEIAWMVHGSPARRITAHGWLAAPVALDGDREAAASALVGVYQRLPGDRASAFLDVLAEATGSGRCPRRLAAREWLTWDMAREMLDGGMSFGGHTAGHPILALATHERQRAEIVACAARLEHELGEPMTLFSYPVGQPETFDDHTRAVLREVGVELAFSDYGGVSRFDAWDPYDVRRSNPSATFDGRMLRAMLTFPRVFARW
jgi:peptidoglycan/xylan/chitin deacetylase (PgdA/CDA1 family)